MQLSQRIIIRLKLKFLNPKWNVYIMHKVLSWKTTFQVSNEATPTRERLRCWRKSLKSLKKNVTDWQLRSTSTESRLIAARRSTLTCRSNSHSSITLFSVKGKKSQHIYHDRIDFKKSNVGTLPPLPQSKRESGSPDPALTTGAYKNIAMII